MFNNNHKKYDPLKIVLTIFVLVLWLKPAAAQENKDIFFFKAKLISADSLLPVADAYVISRHMVWGTISDTNGIFNIHVDNNDTLLISSLGYRNELYAINDSLDRDSLVTIKMHRDTIMLNEVLIRAFWDYETFKQMILDMRLPDDFHIDYKSDDMILNRPLQPAAMGPVQALYNIFNSSARLSRKLIRNRKHYNKIMIQMGRPQDTIPPIPEHMQGMPH